MDIKLKKSKPSHVWLCFFIGVNIVMFLILSGMAVLNDMGEFDMAILGSDIKETQHFKHDIANKFNFLAQSITSEPSLDQNVEERMWMLDNEGENLIYYAKNSKTGKILTNTQADLGISTKEVASLPEGYDYYIYFNGEKFFVEKGGETLDIYRNDSGYRATKLREYMGGTRGSEGTVTSYSTRSKKDEIALEVVDETSDPTTQMWSEEDMRMQLKMAAGEIEGQDQYDYIPDIRDCHILLAVKQNIVENPYAMSSLYWQQRENRMVKGVIIGFFAVLAAGMGLLVFSTIKRRDKREFDKKLAALSGRLCFEIKALVSLMAIFSLMGISGWFFGWIHRIDIYPLIMIIILALVCCWWLYFMWIDLRINGRNFFTKNFINWMIKRYRRFEGKRPFQKALLLRVYAIITVEVILMVLVNISFLFMIGNREGIFILPILVFLGIGLYLLYRYIRRYTSTIDDISEVIDQTEIIKKGDMTTKLSLNPDADLYILEENLNRIQEGVSRAAEERIKSERMKVELITNISHDLKTPLTSIISYVDLLAKEEGLPEYVNDYIKILVKKSDRLKTLIQDLFDLSKAVSGNMEFEKETIDLGKLIEQTLADLEEQISQSQLIFRVNIPAHPVSIISDGKKLYRVFLNVFSNALKYSLAGSRVYVDLMTNDNKAVAVIKNTANYEMNFNEEEILERFVRGDKSRSSEGSGLGLAIAQSFTQACGGSLDIKVDGDLFKVTISFSLEGH